MKLGAAVALVGSLATGCTDGDYTDLDAFADEIAQKFRPVSATDAPPPAASREPFAYAARDLRSPFQPPPVLKPASAAGQPMTTPDFERPRERLEQFPLAQLRLVGNLSSHEMRVALVQDPNGMVHSVAVGEHMGADFGRIVAVGDAGIELVEIVRDAGGWMERPRFIALNGDEGDE